MVQDTKESRDKIESYLVKFYYLDNTHKKELADELELIRAMAEFNGFNLNEIQEEADRKKQKNGGFEKRLLLEKVIKK